MVAAATGVVAGRAAGERRDEREEQEVREIQEV